jgi:hypothetical protein
VSSPTHVAERTRLKKSGGWIQCASGLSFEPLNPRPEDVCINDIAHALSNKCRFTGHTKGMYNVAHHSVLVSRLLGQYGILPLVGLLHDSGEAYLPDIAGPIKSQFYVRDGQGFPKTFAEAEYEVQRAIFEALGIGHLLEYVESEEVKQADLKVLAAEKFDVMGPSTRDWGVMLSAAGIDPIHPWSPEKAELEFLKRYLELRP